MVSIQRIAELLREIFLRCCGENASFFKKKKKGRKRGKGGKGAAQSTLFQVRRPRVGWAFGNWLMEILHFWSRGTFREMKVT